MALTGYTHTHTHTPYVITHVYIYIYITTYYIHILLIKCRRNCKKWLQFFGGKAWGKRRWRNGREGVLENTIIFSTKLFFVLTNPKCVVLKFCTALNSTVQKSCQTWYCIMLIQYKMLIQGTKRAPSSLDALALI